MFCYHEADHGRRCHNMTPRALLIESPGAEGKSLGKSLVERHLVRAVTAVF